MAERTFKLNKAYWDCGNLYYRCNHTLSSGLTVLVGCNGTGKSTMMSQIKAILRKNNESYFAFDNTCDGGSNMYYELLERFYNGGINTLASLMTSSEGEKIQQNVIVKMRDQLNEKVSRAIKSGKGDLFILFDAVDSGASIDNIIEMKNFFRTVIKDQKEKNNLDVYVIVSANSYEMANGEMCYDVSHNKYITFKNYESYKKFILKSREFKERRLKKFEEKISKRGEDRQDEPNLCSNIRRTKKW